MNGADVVERVAADGDQIGIGPGASRPLRPVSPQAAAATDVAARSTSRLVMPSPVSAASP